MDWKPIETATQIRVDSGSRYDLYSARRNIRWLDCWWFPGDDKVAPGWQSTHRYVDEQGRRCATFHTVAEPTHWRLPEPLPPPPHKDSDNG